MARTPSTGWSTVIGPIIRGCVLGLVLGVSVHALLVLCAGNFHAVLPGAVYRCAQPTAESLESMIRQHDIRTVVNLRGCCPNAPWYRAEAEVAAAHGVSLEDINFSATRLPSPQSLRMLVEVIDSADYPILFHCHQGADRTGLASVLTVLLYTDATLEDAMRHLGPATGHLAVGRTRYVDVFFEMYRDWLLASGRTHSPAVLRNWMNEHYCPGEGKARFSLASSPASRRIHLPACSAEVVTVRCRNTSTSPWQFQPGANAGVHLTWSLLNPAQTVCHSGTAGLLRATVGPGEAIDLQVVLPGLAPGRYELMVDLAVEQHGTFIALGNDPFLGEVVVP